MINEKREMCKACATGNNKLPHNGDHRTCVQGRIEYIKTLSEEEQIAELIVHECLPQQMAEYIFDLANQRNKTPAEIVIEEGIILG